MICEKQHSPKVVFEFQMFRLHLRVLPLSHFKEKVNVGTSHSTQLIIFYQKIQGLLDSVY